MNAIVYRSYGPPDVLACEDVEKPTARDDQVLIKVRAASVNPLDWHFMRGEPYFLRMGSGLRKPKVTRLGVDLAGQVEAVGRNVTQCQPGDEVFGTSRGAFAEYVCAAGKVTPVIDRSYALREVPEAIRYLEEGHARGKVLITMDCK
jgi:NADPH:quinone reductase-like Zn-dependent oxidoreductase